METSVSVSETLTESSCDTPTTQMSRFIVFARVGASFEDPFSLWVPWMMYGFCSNNALYSASFSFVVFIFNLRLFQIISQLVNVLKIIVYLKKSINSVS